MSAAIGFVVLNVLLAAWGAGLAGRARRTLPVGTPVPLHAGLGGWDRWQPRDRALLVWSVACGVFGLPSVVILVLVATGAAVESAADTARIAAVLTVPLLILLLSEHCSLRAARRLAQRAADQPDA